MPPKPTHAGLLLSAVLLEAASRGEVADPDALLAMLTPAIDDIEANAHEQLQAARDELANQRKAYDAARAEWRAERVVLAKLRERAEGDAASVTGTPQPGPLDDPHGFYIYFLRDHDDRIAYVGMSTNVLRRIGQHVERRRAAIRRITTVACPDEPTMRRMETRAIREHRPEWNIAGIPA